MELIVIPKGAGKYIINDEKERKIYSVSKKRRLIGNPTTTLHDASGYALYTMVRTASGKKPAFEISFNDKLFLSVQCKSLYVDPSVTFVGIGGDFMIKSKDGRNFEVLKSGEVIGSLKTENQANNEPKYVLNVEAKDFDDFIPLFAIVADKCFNAN